jgi:processive 1,2-diacylglycerol beta-glucosyltransferase
MIKLRDKETGNDLGVLTEEQLRYLTDNLEEEFLEDTDYYVNRDTLDLFAEQGMDKTLLDLLKKAMGDREEMEIEWLVI